MAAIDAKVAGYVLLGSAAIGVGYLLFRKKPDGQAEASALVPAPPPAPPLAPWRQCFLATADRLLESGTLYQWGGGRNPKTDYGVDCSGLFVVAMRECGVPPPPQGTTADVFWHSLQHVTVPQPGDMAFFGRDDKAVHVVMVESVFDNGAVLTIGANGGDRNVTTPDIAIARNARVSRKLVSEFKFAPLLGYATPDPTQRKISFGFVSEPVLCCNLPPCLRVGQGAAHDPGRAGAARRALELEEPAKAQLSLVDHVVRVGALRADASGDALERVRGHVERRAVPAAHRPRLVCRDAPHLGQLLPVGVVRKCRVGRAVARFLDRV